MSYIGTNIISRRPTHYTRRNFGVTIIAAATRYGKSALSKIIYTDIAKYQPILLFDYRGEHGNSRYPNFGGETIRGIPDLYTVENFAFKLSDFSSRSDWASLGFAAFGSVLLSRLAKDVDLHANNPAVFEKILEDLPQTRMDLSGFHGEYPTTQGYITAPLATATVNSVISRFVGVKDTFYHAEGDNQHIPNFGELLNKHHHLHLNLNLTDLDVSIARAKVGKVLHQLHDYLESVRTKNKREKWHLNPLIILEEADKLVPDWKEDIVLPSSLRWIIEYALKYQKYGVQLMLITQDPGLLNSALVSNTHTCLFGQLPDSTKIDHSIQTKTKKLRWDIEKNTRQFVQISKGKENYEIFEPCNCPCL